MSPRAYLCPQPGCGRLVDKRGRCDEHTRSAWRWVYQDPRWGRARRQTFARDGHRCRHVDDGGWCAHVDPTGRTLHAHHHPLSVRELLARGLDPFDTARLVTLCHPHHSRVEAEMRAGRPPAF